MKYPILYSLLIFVSLKVCFAQTDMSFDKFKSELSPNKNWHYGSLYDIGFGINALEGDFLINQNVISYALGFDALKGVGFGTSLTERYRFNNTPEIYSILPVYVYVPIKIPLSQRAKLFISGFAGGSFWCNIGEKERSNTLSSDFYYYFPDVENYYQVGLLCNFFPFGGEYHRSVSLFLDIKFKSGIIFLNKSNDTNQTIFYFSLNASIFNYFKVGKYNQSFLK